jgi:hypothetical protein
MLALTVLGLLGAPGSARAAGAADCAVTEIRASNEKKGVDPALERLRPQLSQPPFASFDSFKLLGEQAVKLEPQKPRAARLTYGAATLLYKGTIEVKAGRARLRIGLDLDDKDGHRVISTVVTGDSGSTMMVSGVPYQGGTYVLALACRAE